MATGCGGDGDDSPEPLSAQEVIAQTSGGVASLTGRSFDQPVGGSGIVIDADEGLILTNSHVVEAVSRLRAKFDAQPQPVPARIRGVAPCDDLAVVELIDPVDGVTALPLGDSDAVERGQAVVAAGYPDNFQAPQRQTLQTTEGTVSNPDVSGHRLGPDLPVYPALIQHQAALNPGNSGGPLLNDLGEVIGINTLSAVGSQGQFYSIDSNFAAERLDGLRRGEDRLRMGWDLEPFNEFDASILEIMLSTFDSELRSEYDVTARQVADALVGDQDMQGMFVWDSEAGLPAREANIVSGDVIQAIDGDEVRSMAGVCRVLESQRPGSTVEVTGRFVNSGTVDQIGESWRVEMELPEEAPEPAEPTTEEEAAPEE